MTTAARYADDLDTVVVNVHNIAEIADNGDGTFDVYLNIAADETEDPEFDLDAQSKTLDEAIAAVKHSTRVSEADENTIRDAFRLDA